MLNLLKSKKSFVSDLILFSGFLVGWDGCMAEDSQSFAAAFRAVKVDSSTNDAGERVHHFMNEQQQMPAKIFAGKLGDLAIRFGRYKFVRFNAPKDLRTGITRQHGMIDNEGDAWHAAEGSDAQCRFDFCLYFHIFIAFLKI